MFGLIQIFIGLSVFAFVANEYKQKAIWLYSTICNIWSAIQWEITKVILNYWPLPIKSMSKWSSERMAWQCMFALSMSILLHLYGIVIKGDTKHKWHSASSVAKLRLVIQSVAFFLLCWVPICPCWTSFCWVLLWRLSWHIITVCTIKLLLLF